jgi:AraC-like DNA-binding protein
MKKQLKIEYEPSIYAQYGTLREFIAEHVIPNICKDQQILKKSIAADLDYSPSHFSQKLYNTGDSRLTVDDMEQIITLYGCGEVLRYLAYQQSITTPRDIQIERLENELKQLRAAK